jgi:alkanesulfonate monooxygenase SsuD/methylene tetrahydromethanopterin reductase-like flavin-dependent oxidoreductase (luciferase family)
MLQEPADVIRRLPAGETVSYRGPTPRLDGARVYSRPDRILGGRP